MDRGWIKLHRKIIDSEIFADPILFKLWCMCLLKANHKTKYVNVERLNRPVKVKPGQFITGRFSLHKLFYPTERKNNKSAITLWRKLELLKKMEILNIETHTTYSIISITNWEKYQQNEQRVNNERTTSEQRVNTNKNDKNYKNEKEYPQNLRNFVEAFYKYIQKETPTKMPKGENIVNNSLKTLDEIIRIDKFEESAVLDIIRWAKKHHFWKGQIYSLASLRKKSQNGMLKFQNMAIDYEEENPDKAKTKEDILKNY